MNVHNGQQKLNLNQMDREVKITVQCTTTIQ